MKDERRRTEPRVVPAWAAPGPPAEKSGRPATGEAERPVVEPLFSRGVALRTPAPPAAHDLGNKSVGHDARITI